MKLTKKQARKITEMNESETDLQAEIEILIYSAQKISRAKWGYIRKILGISNQSIRVSYDEKTRTAEAI